MITNSESPNVWIDNDLISKRVFNNMRNKWLIAFTLGAPWGYVLTPKAIDHYHNKINPH